MFLRWHHPSLALKSLAWILVLTRCHPRRPLSSGRAQSLYASRLLLLLGVRFAKDWVACIVRVAGSRVRKERGVLFARHSPSPSFAGPGPLYHLVLPRSLLLLHAPGNYC